MDGTIIQAKVYAGQGKAASKVGLPFDQYRVTVPRASDALIPFNKIGSLNAWFTIISTTGLATRAPNMKDIAYDGLMDGRGVLPGDLFVNPVSGTFFISSMMPLLPIKAVRCTDTISILRPHQSSAVGNIGYSGLGVEDVIFTGVPCTMQSGGFRSTASYAITPSDAPGPEKWIIHIPPYITDGMIELRDIVVDGNGARYQVASPTWGNFHYMLEAVRLEA